VTFQLLFRARGRSSSQVRRTLLAHQCELREKCGLSYFDSLIAASALSFDCQLISDEAFDKILGLKRILFLA